MMKIDDTELHIYKEKKLKILYGIRIITWKSTISDYRLEKRLI